MLKGIGFLLLGLGLALQIPKYVKKYQNGRKWEDLLELIGIIILVPSGFILGIAQFLP